MNKFAAFAIIALFVQVSAMAQVHFNSFDDDETEAPWAEAETQLPTFPVAENLIPFSVGANSQTTYAIDRKSLSLGEDGVLRFTLVIKTSSGAENVSYDGLRCATSERRSYAFGRPDGTWSPARSKQWVKVRGTSNNHFVELYSSYFCSAGTSTIRSAEDAVRILEQGGQPR